MKHIRLFEGYTTEDFYVKSNVDDYTKCIMEPFENRWMLMLEKLGLDFEVSEVRKKKWIHSNDGKWLAVQTYDEYFWFVKGDDYYKCDQFDGLKRLLMDKNLIKKK